MTRDEDLNKLLENLPFFIKQHVNSHIHKDKIIEIILDLGRRPEARFPTGPEYLSQKIISWQDIEYTTKRISKLSNDNRAGIERTLHRIKLTRVAWRLKVKSASRTQMSHKNNPGNMSTSKSCKS